MPTHSELPKRPFVAEAGKWLCALGSVFIEKDGRPLMTEQLETQQTAFCQAFNSGPGALAGGFDFDVTCVLSPSPRGGEHSSVKLCMLMPMSTVS